MTAKEMFEQLGYELVNEDYFNLTYYNSKEDAYIYFYKTKIIEVSFDITISVLKAINKQVEELGWNNEK